MNPKRHRIIHNVVLLGYVAEHSAHHLLLLLVVYSLEAEVNLLVTAESTDCSWDYFFGL